MFERFTDEARRSLVFAHDEGMEWGHNYLGCEHLVIGLLRESDGIAGRALISLGVTLELARKRLEHILGQGPLKTGMSMKVPFTPRAKQALELSAAEALELGHNYIGTEHVLLGILKQNENLGCRILTELEVETPMARAKILELIVDTGVGITSANRVTEPGER
jgi:ATP-dependent Clp protease ATP-binding subunit ClpC